MRIGLLVARNRAGAPRHAARNLNWAGTDGCRICAQPNRSTRNAATLSYCGNLTSPATRLQAGPAVWDKVRHLGVADSIAPYNPDVGARSNSLSLMQSNNSSPAEAVASLWRNKALIFVLIQREVLGRYRGSTIGLLWSFLNPIFMLLIYTFVFSVVFKARWSGVTGTDVGDSKVEFSLLLFAGLIVYNLFAECINRAPVLILSNANYVKKVVFPLEVLPWVTVGCALFHAAVSMSVWLLAYTLMFGIPHVTALFLPLVFAPLVLLIVGLGWILAALGVYLRDVSQFIGILTTMMLFLSPVFYPTAALPEQYRPFLYLNPLTTIIEQTRKVLYWGVPPDWLMLLASFIVAVLVASFGFFVFQSTRKGFADVL